MSGFVPPFGFGLGGAGAVTPRVAPITTVTTSGTPVVAATGPINGFLLMAGTAAITWSLTGAAAATVGAGTFSLAIGQWILFDKPLAASISLSVNGGATPTPFSCMIW